MTGWSLIVPAKPLAVAKTRLRSSGWQGAALEELVLAMLGDTLVAATGSPVVDGVWLVTDEERAAAVARELDVHVLADVPGAGLNAALAFGALAAPTAPVATLHADLPALRPAELTAALGAAARHRRSYVRDADGTGTTLLAVTAGDLLPSFGPGSAVRHEATGAVPLHGAWPGLRRDVDTAAHLALVRSWDTGPRTAAVDPGRVPPTALRGTVPSAQRS